MMPLGKVLQTAIQFLKLVSIEPYFFLCFFGFSVRLASYQSLLMESACRNLYEYSEKICNDLEHHPKELAKSVAAGNNLYMGIMLWSSLPAVFVAIFLGPWSDKYSRKYPLTISATGLMVESAAGAVLTAFPRISTFWYVATATFSGVTGGIIICASGSSSYVADITDERSRPARYSMLEFSGISAIITGSLIGGQLFQHFGYIAVMICSPAAFLMAVLYSIFIVKETKPPIPAERRVQMVKDLFTFDNVRESFKTCMKKRPGNLRLQIWFLVWITCSQKFVDMGTLAVAFPFAKKMYKWDVADFSNASTAFYVANALVTVTLVPVLSNILKLHEAALGVIGMLSLMAKMVLISVANNVPIFYYAWMAGTMNNFTAVAVRSRLSKLVRKDESGRAFSLLGTCESLTPLLGTVAFLQLYNVASESYPGLPFAAAAVFLLPSLMIFSWMTKMPTVSLAEFAIAEEEAKNAKPLRTFSINRTTEDFNYSKLQEENT